MSFWTVDRIEDLRCLAPKRSASEIAAQLGCSRNAIIGKAHRLHIQLGKAPAAPSAPVVLKPVGPPKPVPAERPARGKYECVREGWFHSRCADCGKLSGEIFWGKSGAIVAPTALRRSGWTMSGSNRHSAWSCPACSGVPAPVPIRSSVASRPFTSCGPPVEKARDAGPAREIAPANPKTIAELRDCECHWPIGDPMTPDFRYCGGPRSLPSPYCASHRALARGAGTSSERQAANVLKRVGAI